MKKLFFLLFVFFCWTAQAQVTFHSAYTEHWPQIFQSEITEVNRSISIGKNEIVIMTDTDQGKQIENLQVEFIDERRASLVFHCRGKIGREPVTVVVPLKKAGVIDLYRISRKTGEEEQLRFYLY